MALTEEVDEVACGIEIGRGDFVSLATLAGGYPAVPFTVGSGIDETVPTRHDRVGHTAANVAHDWHDAH